MKPLQMGWFVVFFTVLGTVIGGIIGYLLGAIGNHGDQSGGLPMLSPLNLWLDAGVERGALFGFGAGAVALVCWSFGNKKDEH